MKKKIAILGSTGSIGKTLINFLKSNKNNISILLLSTNKNFKEIIIQAKFFNVKNLIITDKKIYDYVKNKKKFSRFKIYNNFNSFNKIFYRKIDYVMSSISGLDGLIPTLKIIKFTKTIAIANKESIICGWGLINKELSKNKTSFIPVDSEHYSIWYALKDINKKLIDKIFITASGGPFNKTKISDLKFVKKSQALKHPNWRMGKKITIDSSTMINKLFEIIEAKNIFNISYNKISIIIHPESYIHCIIKFKNGLIKIVAHDTTMLIPISNSINFLNESYVKSDEVKISKLNNLTFEKLDENKFKIQKILDLIPENHSLFETILVSANDTLVNLYLNEKIGFTDIKKELINFLSLSEFTKFKRKVPSKISQIIELSKYVSLKLQKKYV